MPSLVLEAVTVGAVLAACLAIVVRLTGPLTSSNALLAGFVLGVTIHMGFELTGANRWYCTKGWACRP